MTQELNEANFEVGTSRVFLVIHHRHSPDYIAQAIKIIDTAALIKGEVHIMAEIANGMIQAATVPIPQDQTEEERVLTQEVPL